MEKIPTIKELFNKYSNLYQFEEGDPKYLIDREDFMTALTEFTKLHVKAALEAATKRAVAEAYQPDYGAMDAFIDKESILSAYPEENIK